MRTQQIFTILGVWAASMSTSRSASFIVQEYIEINAHKMMTRDMRAQLIAWPFSLYLVWKIIAIIELFSLHTNYL